MAAGAKKKTHPERVKAVFSESDALRLRRDGKTYQQISKELGCSSGTAYQAVKRGLAKLNEEVGETAAEVRTIEVERLDTACELVMRKLGDGEMEAVGPLLRIMERRARLLGLDAPPPISTDGADLLERLAAELRARHAPPDAQPAPDESEDLEGAGQSAPIDTEDAAR